jgi:hypothetical protein
MMKKKFKSITNLFLLAFIISCVSTTTGGQLKQSNPVMYDDIIGTWYILSNENPGEIKYTISFNDNGSVTGDIDLFGFKDVNWSETEFALNSDYDNINYRIFKIYNLNNTFEIYYDVDKYEKDSAFEYPNINPAYLNYIPSLKIMQIRKEEGKIESFVYSRNLNIINNLKKAFFANIENDKKKWNSLDKNSLAGHIAFLKSVKHPELKSKAQQSLNDLLDKKTIRYIQKEYKVYSKYLNSMIVYVDGTKMCKFYEFLKIPILFKNKTSGEKINISFKKNKSFENGFDIVCQINGKELNITFKPYKDKIVLVGLSSGYQVNPKGWENAVSTISLSWNKYPDDLASIDLDLLENL